MSLGQKHYSALTCLLVFKTNNELSGESTGSKSFRILSCNNVRTLQHLSVASAQNQSSNMHSNRTSVLLLKNAVTNVQGRNSVGTHTHTTTPPT